MWHEKLNGFFYVLTSEDRKNDIVMYHSMGDSPSSDQQIFRKSLQGDTVFLIKSSSRQQLFIILRGVNDNISYVIDMNNDDFQPQLVRARREGVSYDLDHNGEHFYIRINDQTKDFRIVRIKTDDLHTDSWQESYVSGETGKFLQQFALTKSYLILSYLNCGLPVMEIKHLVTGEHKTINFPDAICDADIVLDDDNFAKDNITIRYSSLKQPHTCTNYELTSLEPLKLDVPSSFNSAEYNITRITTTETQVPITILYKTSLFKQDGSNPLYLQGYGAYGIGSTVGFNPEAIALANHGFVYAISHVRGGDELGPQWHEDGRLLNKKQTFEDFIASAEQLIADRYTSSGNIVIYGASAGGMLVGVVMNQRPELFKAVIANIPFIDVLNTLLDETRPNAQVQFAEFGNPKEPEYFDYIKSYSPYDNIKRQPYPHLMVTAGQADSRVGYWEPAKWLAKLRDYRTNNNLSLLQIDAHSGHLGPSDRSASREHSVNKFVFILTVFDKIPVAINS